MISLNLYGFFNTERRLRFHSYCNATIFRVSVYSQETLIKIEEKRRYIILDI